jgi:gluconate 5-dehydrogenase
VLQLTRAIAQEWSKYGITCNAIGPGFFPTALTAPVFGDPGSSCVRLPANRTAIGRNGGVKDTVWISHFFSAAMHHPVAPDKTIMLDGGYTAT